MDGHELLLRSAAQDPIIAVSASQSLQASARDDAAISTGLPRLDRAIALGAPGIQRGQVTEVFGPPGAGKTALALNVTANALRAGNRVVWIDTSSPLPTARLKSMLDTTGADRLSYYRTPSLPHLLALLLHPPARFPPPDTALLVVDSVSAPFPGYFANPTELKARRDQGKIPDKAQFPWLMNRKWNVTGDLANQLARLAAAHHRAVLVITQTHTKIRGLPRATLYPVLAGGAWESAVSTRMVLYGDLLVHAGRRQRLRCAEMLKRGGRAISARREEDRVSFTIESDGLHELDSIDAIDGLPERDPIDAIDGLPEPDSIDAIDGFALAQPAFDQPLDLKASQLNKLPQETGHDTLGLNEEPEASDTPDEPPSQLKPDASRKRKMAEIADSQDEDSDYGWPEGVSDDHYEE
ncbi:hypothetical protein ASPZODRAFT_137099 [Penicilliopsis zonata CBS 506.65]|uniref:RecA family profile 1 domain-containing protein n=1 Tax=Penicilliopsis zonata CBS 506.65 TaxID=1073090 RepID=A0A1L9S6B8_9EURO|nr:hypothetical protein ASPZODRAFT_137099 [Penicilliopsis zonata CBS 506.65]OJJ42711.1 hypothetical protein ASPZODRAFT_137099 [Penicilliopsis zonata CBS 506.65]